MNTSSQSVPPPHVLIFPLPLQGPIKAMLVLAELLCQAGIHVTFLNTEHNHRRLLCHSDTKIRFSNYQNFHLETISDGLPEEHPRTLNLLSNLFDNLRVVTGPLFRKMMTTGSMSVNSDIPVSFIIAEGALEFVFDVCDEVGIPLFVFETVSSCSLWTFLSVHKLIDAGELPFKGEDLDAPIRSVAGMEGFLRRRDLPDFYRNQDMNNIDFNMNEVLTEGQRLPRGHGLILNTFEDLEGPILSHIKTITQNIYPIGPLHTLLKSRTKAENLNSSSSLWQEDHSCIAWLDSQPKRSVLYISFGSLAMITFEQLMELWHGVVNSGKRFLWIKRPGSTTLGVNDEDLIPKELLEGTKERGCIVSWGPQEEILAHRAIGGFLTHSGWNSTLESIAEGVPMLCWPERLDQQVNSRYASEVWKVGIDMKDTCDRLIIEKNIRVLMDTGYNGFTHYSNRLAKLARESVLEGGSSVRHLNRLINDIKSMSCKSAPVR